MMTLKEYARSTKFFMVAHRAGAGDSIELENSLVSIEKAIQMGIKAIEIDLVACKDEVIAYHDDCLVESNRQIKFENENFSAIAKLKSGLLTLDKVIELVKEKSYLVLELKESCSIFTSIILKKIINADMIENTIFVSFYPQILNEIKKATPNALVGYIAEPDKNIMPSEVAKYIDFDLFVNDINEITPKIADDAKSIGMPFACYGVNSQQDLDKALQLGVSSVGTDYPEKLMAMQNIS